MAPGNPFAPERTTARQIVALTSGMWGSPGCRPGDHAVFLWAAMAQLAVPPVYQALALHTLLGWPVPMFSYWYDRMHKRNFWLTLKTQKTARPASPECGQ